MGQKIPWVTTLGQKTLEPFYKYIVKGSPKRTFLIFYFVNTLGHLFSQVFKHKYSHTSSFELLRSQVLGVWGFKEGQELRLNLSLC